MTKPYNKTADKIITIAPAPTVVTVITANDKQQIFRITMENGTCESMMIANGTAKNVTIDERYLYIAANGYESAMSKVKKLIKKFKPYAGKENAG